MEAVSSVGRAIENIRLYEECLASKPQMQDRIRRHAAWYAFREAGVWRFGPSKFVGYEGITAKDYLASAKGSLDGRETESRLKRWFTPVDPASDQFHEPMRCRVCPPRSVPEPRSWRSYEILKRYRAIAPLRNLRGGSISAST